MTCQGNRCSDSVTTAVGNAKQHRSGDDCKQRMKLIVREPA